LPAVGSCRVSWLALSVRLDVDARQSGLSRRLLLHVRQVVSCGSSLNLVLTWTVLFLRRSQNVRSLFSKVFPSVSVRLDFRSVFGDVQGVRLRKLSGRLPFDSQAIVSLQLSSADFGLLLLSATAFLSVTVDCNSFTQHIPYSLMSALFVVLNYYTLFLLSLSSYI
jgi:hypothetical protein